jgi:hypothetical protein
MNRDFYFVSGGFPARFRRHLNENERVKKMGFDAGRWEVGRVGFEKNDADDIVADVPFSLQLISTNEKTKIYVLWW